MSQLFDVTEEGKVRIVGAKIRDNALPEKCESRLAYHWQVSMTRDSQGQLIASEFKLSQ